jgi:large subunit ribosomal protein L35
MARSMARSICPDRAAGFWENLGAGRQKRVAFLCGIYTIPRPMPKSIARRKTKKAVAKRFKLTATGKLLRRKPGLRHLASSKNAKRKRNLGKATLVHETMVPRLKECMPFA